MTPKEIQDAIVPLLAMAVALGPLVECLVTLLTLAWRDVPAAVKPVIAGVLNVGGALAISLSMGWLPVKYGWVAGVLGLASWLASYGNHKANVAVEGAR